MYLLCAHNKTDISRQRRQPHAGAKPGKSCVRVNNVLLHLVYHTVWSLSDQQRALEQWPLKSLRHHTGGCAGERPAGFGPSTKCVDNKHYTCKEMRARFFTFAQDMRRCCLADALESSHREPKLSIRGRHSWELHPSRRPTSSYREGVEGNHYHCRPQKSSTVDLLG